MQKRTVSPRRPHRATSATATRTGHRGRPVRRGAGLGDPTVLHHRDAVGGAAGRDRVEGAHHEHRTCPPHQRAHGARAHAFVNCAFSQLRGQHQADHPQRAPQCAQENSAELAANQPPQQLPRTSQIGNYPFEIRPAQAAGGHPATAPVRIRPSLTAPDFITRSPPRGAAPAARRTAASSSRRTTPVQRPSLGNAAEGSSSTAPIPRFRSGGPRAAAAALGRPR